MRGYCSRLATLALVAASLFVTGCQKSAETNVEAPADGPTSVDRPSKPKSSNVDDPAATWTSVVKNVVDGETDILARALPERYGEDLDRVLAAGVASLDPHLRGEAADAIAALAETLVQKEKFVLASSRFNFGGPAAPFVRAHFAELCRVVVAVAKWPQWAAPAAPDSNSLMQAVSRAVVAEPALLEGLQSIRFQNAGAKNDSQRQILVSTPAASQPRTVDIVNVEGRWLPRSLVEQWSELFGPQQAEALTADAARRENRLRDFTSQLREISRSLDAVKTQAEFDELVERASTLLMASAAGAHPTPRRVESDEFVTVVVEGRLSDEQKDRIVWELASKSDEPVSSLADAVEQSGGESFVVHVGPVGDVEAFAKRLENVVAVEKVDAGARKITARVAAP